MTIEYNRIQGQLSEDIIAQYPILVEFLTAYYNFLDTQIEVIKDTSTYADIDSAFEIFKEYFYSETMGDIPKNILADRTLLAKHIKELYVSKGSESSYALLFRILFDKEIVVNSPAEQIFKLSDGKWTQNVSFVVHVPKTVSDSDVLKCIDQNILVSVGAAEIPVTVLGVSKISSIDTNNNLFEFFIDKNFNNTIEIGATVRFLRLGNVSVVSGGSGYSLATTEIIVRTLSGKFASLIAGISSVNGKITSVVITDKGYGYIDPPGIIAVDPKGTGATFIAETENIFVGTILPSLKSPKIINAGSGFREGTTFQITNPISGTGATLQIGNASNKVPSNISLLSFGEYYPDEFNFVVPEKSSIAVAHAIVTGGSVTSLVLESGGSGYITPPTVYLAGNAIFTANISGGVVTSFNTISTGSGYSSVPPAVYFSQDSLVLNFTSTGLRYYKGYYKDTNGFLSADNVLYDGIFYNKYSYELEVSELFDSYKGIVRKLLHPVGFGMYGKYVSDRSIPLSLNMIKLAIDKLLAYVDAISISENTTFAVNKVIDEYIHVGFPAQSYSDNFYFPDGYIEEIECIFDINKLLSDSVSCSESETFIISSSLSEAVSISESLTFDISTSFADSVVSTLYNPANAYSDNGYFSDNYTITRECTFS